MGRQQGPIWFSEIAPDVDRLDDAGNRFDVLGAGVLYASTQAVGAYVETLQQFRPTTRTRAAARRTQPGLMLAGAVSADWAVGRRRAEFQLHDPLPFFDMDDPRNHTLLDHEVGAELAALGVQNLNVAVVRSDHRLVTRLLATWAYLATDEDERPRFAGLRFVSKLGAHESWAIFSGAEIRNVCVREINANDPDLKIAAAQLGLSLHLLRP